MKTAYYLKITLGFYCFCVAPIVLADTANITEKSFPEVACRYETTVISTTKPNTSKSTWYFWRQADRVQTLDADGDYGEIWQLTPTGHIQYRKLYPKDKTAVEYMPADNPTHNLHFDWSKIASMLSPQELAALKAIKKTQILGRNAELRKGFVNHQSIEVKWLLNEQLPASIIRKDKNRTIQLRLLSLEAPETAQQKLISITEIDNYRQIDAVDFGDMENDPFVKKVMAREGHHH